MSLETREKHQVGKVSPACRIYDYLPGKFSVIPSRKGIKKALKRGQIYRNGEIIHESDYIYEGDIIELKISEKLTKPYLKKINVFHEDDFLAVVDKPPGLVVSGNQWKTLEHALIHNLKISEQNDYLPFPLATHRIDAMTSGLVLIAKTYKTRRQLGEMFKNSEVSKGYYAVVYGKTDTDFEIRTPIGDKAAKTTFSLIKSKTIEGEAVSLLNCNPVTGRKHQIRIHLKENGTPIIGDKVYGESRTKFDNKSMFLCSCRLEFLHPITREKLAFERDLPKKFRSLIE